MRQVEPGGGGPFSPFAALREFVPFEAAAASDRRGWSGLEAARYRAAPASELRVPALSHHAFIRFARPPEELDLLYDGVKRHVPPPA
jgi:hypothetical protein